MCWTSLAKYIISLQRNIWPETKKGPKNRSAVILCEPANLLLLGPWSSDFLRLMKSWTHHRHHGHPTHWAPQLLSRYDGTHHQSALDSGSCSLLRWCGAFRQATKSSLLQMQIKYRVLSVFSFPLFCTLSFWHNTVAVAMKCPAAAAAAAPLCDVLYSSSHRIHPSKHRRPTGLPQVQTMRWCWRWPS